MATSRRYFYTVTVNNCNTSEFATRKLADDFRNECLKNKLSGNKRYSSVSEVKTKWEKHN